MSAAPEITPENHIGFYFETNEGISLKNLGAFLMEIEHLAKLKSHFGPAAKVEIVGAGTGTFWMEIAISAISDVSTALVESFVKAILSRFKRKKGKLAEAIAALAMDNGVVSAEITTKDQKITIQKKDLGAIETVAKKRSDNDGYVQKGYWQDGLSEGGFGVRAFGEGPFGG